MALTGASGRAAAPAEMEMLRAEVRALGRRLSRDQMLELAEIMSETAGGGEPRTWRPEVASPR